MKLPEQVVRLGTVLIVLLAIVLSLRFLILPASFFSARPHQAAKVEREMVKPLHYAGTASCRECHEQQVNAQYASYHRNIGCENCHGPSAEHAAGDKSAMPRKDKDREFCLACHAYDAARPNGFPQVDPQQHNPRKQCVRCHDPHDPAPPEKVQDCGGCHGRIARIKALSTHTQLACSECHKAEPQHLLQPRSALPTKPSGREACNRCHAATATDPAASKARIDPASHGGKYLCWECHYAHLPEGPK